MKIKVKEVLVGDVFTESGITVEVVAIHEANLVNGTLGIQLVVKTLKYNPKIFSRHTKVDEGFGYYNKKSETSISVTRKN